MNELVTRLEYLAGRLQTSYDGIGHSSGRPFVYFVYPPSQERAMCRLVDDHLASNNAMRYHHLDLLGVTIESLAGQEARREQFLNDPLRRSGIADSIVGIWARALSQRIAQRLQDPGGAGRPAIVLRGVAALHPLSNPTKLMEKLAEQEPRDPRTNRMVPLIILVPGVRPPQTSRTYRFLSLEAEEHTFYRGEEA